MARATRLLPGPALAGEEHRRLRRSDLGGAGERLAEGRGAADDPVEAVPVAELAWRRCVRRCSRWRARPSAWARCCCSLARRWCWRATTTWAAIACAISTSALSYQSGWRLAKNRTPPTSSAEPERHREAGAVPALDDAPIPRPGRIQLPLGVADAHGGVPPGPSRRKDRSSNGIRAGASRTGRVGHPANQLHVAAAVGEEPHAHHIEVQDGADRLGHLLESLREIQAGAEDAGQAAERGQSAPAPLLAMEDDEVFDERRDEIGYVLGRGEVGLARTCSA